MRGYYPRNLLEFHHNQHITLRKANRLTPHADYVQDMFGRIARRYDLMNRLMTFGQDRRWRRFVIQQAQLPVGGHLLDIATGTPLLHVKVEPT